jgi:hypothetical protein
MTFSDRTYFPEEFLWKAFHSMAQVAKIMEDGEYYDPETGVAPHVPYKLIHSDIKPLNGKSIPSSISHASCVNCYRLFCGVCCQATSYVHCHYV